MTRTRKARLARLDRLGERLHEDVSGKIVAQGKPRAANITNHGGTSGNLCDTNRLGQTKFPEPEVHRMRAPQSLHRPDHARGELAQGQRFQVGGLELKGHIGMKT